TSPPRSRSSGMGLGVYQRLSVAEPAERAAIREHAEHAAGVDEADAPAQRRAIALEGIEYGGEGLRGVHGIEEQAFETRQAHDHLEILAPDLRPSCALV